MDTLTAFFTSHHSLQIFLVGFLVALVILVLGWWAYSHFRRPVDGLDYMRSIRLAPTFDPDKFDKTFTSAKYVQSEKPKPAFGIRSQVEATAVTWNQKDKS